MDGMRNENAQREYPGLYWNTMGWEECYPGGESPKQFYERITAGWKELVLQCRDEAQDVILVTNGA